jgi:hypothetical protein
MAQSKEASQWAPAQPQPLIMEEFQGMYTSTTRPGVDDKQCWWIDGFMPLGKMDLRTLPGVGPAFFTAETAGSIAFFDFFNIGSQPYGLVVINDGSVFAVNTNTASSRLIAPPGTIANPSRQSVGLNQYGSEYVLIVANQANGYFIWDGTSFFVPGDVGPDGGTVPLGIGGTAVETYQGRVWIAQNATVYYSAPGSVTDFSSADGGGNFTSADSFLRVGYVALIQTNGFLYLIGDSSINYISGVQTSGSPPVTTFTNQNADPEVGTPYPATVQVFGRNIVFANAWGAHISYGAAVTKISEALDGFYASVPNFAGQQLSAAKAIIYSKKVWMMLVPVIDLFTGQQRNKLLMWNGQIWWASEQDIGLTYIQSQEINSIITAWGTDGTALRQLFQNPTNGFTKRVMSKFWTTPIGYQEFKTANQFWGVAQYYNFSGPEVTLYIETENTSATGGNSQVTLTPTNANSLMNWTTLGGEVMNWTTEGGQQMIWSAIGTGFVVFQPTAVAQNGVLLGFTLETVAADMALVSSMVGVNIAYYRGK